MATMSIEILCVGGGNFHLQHGCIGLGVDISFPPISDRSPSIWQKEIDKIGGTLVHLYDEILTEDNFRCAYRIVDEIEWKRFRFVNNIDACVWSIISDMIESSPVRCAWLYVDAQWSNKPKKFKKIYSIKSLKSYHDAYGIRMNSAIMLTG